MHPSERKPSGNQSVPYFLSAGRFICREFFLTFPHQGKCRLVDRLPADGMVLILHIFYKGLISCLELCLSIRCFAQDGVNTDSAQGLLGRVLPVGGLFLFLFTKAVKERDGCADVTSIFLWAAGFIQPVIQLITEHIFHQSLLAHVQRYGIRRLADRLLFLAGKINRLGIGCQGIL